MSPPATITVRGTALARAEPDEAELLITLSALAPDPGASLGDVSGRAHALAELLDELDVARSERSSTGITIYEEVEHISGRRRDLGHRAVATLTVRLTDADRIGTLVTRASTELAAHISGPHWQIAPENPVRLEVARAAAANGRRKAEAYASGVGARLGSLLNLAEPEEPPLVRSRRLSGKFHPASTNLPVEAGEQAVVAAIDLTFALETT